MLPPVFFNPFSLLDGGTLIVYGCLYNGRAHNNEWWQGQEGFEPFLRSLLTATYASSTQITQNRLPVQNVASLPVVCSSVEAKSCDQSQSPTLALVQGLLANGSFATRKV